MAAQPTMDLRRPPMYCATRFLQLLSVLPASSLCRRDSSPENPEGEQRRLTANFMGIKQLQTISITLEKKSYTRRG
jgi:hypothetical protein